jgi:uncharacterized membrane protein
MSGNLSDAKHKQTIASILLAPLLLFEFSARFPSETIPDGDVLAPHHLYFGVLALLLVAWVVSDDYRDREAWAIAVGALAALVGFTLTWRHYPTVGAAMTLAGLSAALVALTVRPYWAAYSWLGFRGAALLAVSIALDDAVEHALGVPTPLDELWSRWLFPVVVRTIEGGA